MTAEKMRRIFLSVFSYALAIAGTSFLVWSVSQSSWTNREPASIPNSYKYDLPELKEAKNLEQASNALMAEAKVLEQKQKKGLQLGSFHLTAEDGSLKTICQTYNKVGLKFSADGVVVNGERPTMEVIATCSEDKSGKLDVVWIPYYSVTKENAAQDLDVNYASERVRMRFEHVFGEWPSSWVLTQIRLFNEADKSQNLVIESHELLKSHKPVSLNWDLKE